MPPDDQQQTMLITSTNTITISNSNELKSMDFTEHAKANYALLEKMMPELKTKPLDYSLCP